MLKKTFIFLLLGVNFLMSSCYFDNTEKLYPSLSSANCNVEVVSYSGNVSPILQTYCVSCHNSTLSSGGVALDTYASVKSNATAMIGAINHAAGFSQMPKNSDKLSDCQIRTIASWVDKGMLNN